MIVIDKSALVAIAAGEPEAQRFSDVIADAAEAVIGAPTALEFIMVTNGARLKP